MNAVKPRWKLFLVLLLLPCAVWAVAHTRFAVARGAGGALNLLACLLGFVVVLFWLLLLSRLRWKTRLIGVGILGALMLALGLSLRVEGHMGDYFPQVAWRWSPQADESLDSLAVERAPVPPAGLTTDTAADFPRFLGPDGNNHVSGDLLPGDWPGRTPKELWRREIGLGWSSFVVAGPYAFTMEQREDKELTVCYQARSGAPVWLHSENVRFSESMGGDGPRSTPAVHDGRVYALGATGILLCLDGATGSVQWRRDTLREADQGNLTWAKSGSPLIVDDLVVVTLGDSRENSLAAFDRLTGEPRWQSGSDKPSYATPIVATLAGQRQIVAFNKASVSGHGVGDGAQLWNHPVAPASAHAATPVSIGRDRVFAGAGYGRGSQLLRVTAAAETGGQTVERVWHSRYMKPKFADVVVREGYVYGLDEGRLSCMALADGSRVWRGRKFGHGQVLGVGDHLLIQAENGGIAVARADPKGQQIVHEFDALGSKTWNHPTLAGRLLLVRNDREAIAFEFAPD